MTRGSWVGSKIENDRKEVISGDVSECQIGRSDDKKKSRKEGGEQKRVEGQRTRGEAEGKVGRWNRKQGRRVEVEKDNEGTNQRRGKT
jgi:hypothetical protein